MKLPRPAFILSVVVAAVLIVAGFGALLLPRIVDSPIPLSSLKFDQLHPTKSLCHNFARTICSNLVESVTPILTHSPGTAPQPDIWIYQKRLYV